ncbi:MAG: permease [Treponemataceae bacterium]
MLKALQTEFLFIYYYVAIMIEQILPFWALGIFMGSAISVFGKNKIHNLFEHIFGQNKNTKKSLLASFFIYSGASFLGIISPLCMYGTIPIASSFSKKGIPDDILAAFMMSSILLNPQLIMYTFILGNNVVLIRFVTSLLCGIIAAFCVRFFFRNKSFFNFLKFTVLANNDTQSNLFKRFILNIGRNIKITLPYFALGILLTALYQQYVPQDFVSSLFGKEHKAFGVLFATTLGVPLYMCGGGAIPLLWEWMHRGMTLGSATAFMISGSATKITNLGALKIVLGSRHFLYYLFYVILFSFSSGIIINLLVK